jgi:CheY-like chemotaxis protein
MKTVLVADDDADFRRFLRITLELEGYGVEEARNGTEALLKLRAAMPSMVLLDFDLGDPDGGQVVAAVRLEPSMRSLPIVLVSTQAPYRLPGVQAVLQKPVDPAKLIEVVKAVLDEA